MIGLYSIFLFLKLQNRLWKNRKVSPLQITQCFRFWSYTNSNFSLCIWTKIFLKTTPSKTFNMAPNEDSLISFNLDSNEIICESCQACISCSCPEGQGFTDHKPRLIFSGWYIRTSVDPCSRLWSLSYWRFPVLFIS